MSSQFNSPNLPKPYDLEPFFLQNLTFQNWAPHQPNFVKKVQGHKVKYGKAKVPLLLWENYIVSSYILWMCEYFYVFKVTPIHISVMFRLIYHDSCTCTLCEHFKLKTLFRYP